MKDKTTALILTALGFAFIAGLQHFYLDKPLKGLLYLVTFGFFGIGTLIDLFTIGESVNEWNKKWE